MLLGVTEQPGKGVGAGVVEGMLAPRVGRLAEQAIDCRFGHALGLQLIAPLQDRVLGRLQHAVKPPERRPWEA